MNEPQPDSDDLTLLSYQPQLLSDLKMLYQSVKGGWNVSDQVKSVAMRRLKEILASENSSRREYLAACRVLSMFDRSDLERFETILKAMDPDRDGAGMSVTINQQNNVTVNNNHSPDIQAIMEEAEAEGYADELRQLAEREGIAGFGCAGEAQKE